MSDKSIDQFLFEYKSEFNSTDSDVTPVSKNGTGNFRDMTQELGSYARMMAILAGQENFEYNLLDNPKMVRALIDNIEPMVKNKEKISTENKSISQKIKELEKNEFKTQEEKDELKTLKNKDKAYQLQKTLMMFGSKIGEIDDILSKIEKGEKISDKMIKKYETLVGEIEDALFNETYVRRNAPYDRGEASGRMKKPTATDNFPIMFRANNDKTYYGIVRPPSGIITWEGVEAREAWTMDPDILSVVEKNKKSPKEVVLKLRIDKDSYTVLSKEKINHDLFSLRTKNGLKKVEYRDDDTTKEAIRNFIFDESEDGGKEVADYSVMSTSSIDDVISVSKTKVVQPALDKQGRPKDLTNVIDSIEFWRFIRGLFK